jgi:hypothetical protein
MLSSEEFRKQNAECPDIGLIVANLTTPNLWREILGRASHQSWFAAPKASRQSEIDQGDPIARTKHHVLRLEIEMKHTGGMGRLQGFANRDRYSGWVEKITPVTTPSRICLIVFAVDPFAKADSLDLFECKTRSTAPGSGSVNRRNARVLEPSRCPNLGKPLRLREIDRHKLQGHRPIEFGIVSQVHRTHTAQTRRC